MNRILIYALIFLGNICIVNAQSSANKSINQNKQLKDSTLRSIDDDMNYFPSCFRKIDSGDFKGRISGVLNLRTKGSKIQRIVFDNVPVQLMIESHKKRIYDNSFKKYQFEANGVKFSYTTYLASNKIILFLNGKQFVRNLIDGDCHHRIFGLNAKYTTSKNSELLSLWVTNTVGLFQFGKPQSLTESEAWLLPGTKLDFNIERNPTKVKLK